MMRRFGQAGWVVALLALGALGIGALEHRSLYIRERLTSLERPPAVSATKRPGDWAAASRRLLLTGDSRIQEWRPLPRIADTAIALSGVGRETVGQLERRFARDVLDQSPPPDLVIIAAGINDLVAASLAERYAGAIRDETVELVAARLTGLARTARAAGIEARIATIVQPADPDPVRRALIWDDVLWDLVTRTNARLAEAAAAEGIALVDFNAALGGGDGPLPMHYARDTLHFNSDAYARLGEVLRAETAAR